MGEKLFGGFRNDVERHGEHVIRRRHGEIQPFAWPTLKLLESYNWPSAPRLITPGDEEVLTYMPGIVPGRSDLPSWSTSQSALRMVGRLTREFHDFTASSALSGNREVICHNDLAPANTVYDADALLPYAFIDWDDAAPGNRIDDIGHAAWQWLQMGPGASVESVANGILSILEGYGGEYAVVDVLVASREWQLQTANGIEAGADSDPNLMALMETGVPADCRASANWVDENTEAILEFVDRI